MTKSKLRTLSISSENGEGQKRAGHITVGYMPG